MLTTKEYVETAMRVIEDHANEDYDLCVPRNEELTALAFGIVFAIDNLGPITAVTKECIVAAYLMGRADALNGE